MLLAGQVSEAQKHALFNSCDIFALASRERTEAFGLVLIEAMQHGKPCIASDLDGSGMSWVVGQSGEGQCYAPDQVQAWKEAIRQSLDAKAQLAQRGKLAQQVADAQFTIAQCEQRIRQIYRSFQPPPETRTAELEAHKHLLVAVLTNLADLDLIHRWHPTAADQQLLCIVATTSQADTVTALQQLSVPSLSLTDMDWNDAIEVVHKLVSEQAFSELSIFPAHQLLRPESIIPVNSHNAGVINRFLQIFGLKHRDLRTDQLTLQDLGVTKWIAKPPSSVGAHIFL